MNEDPDIVKQLREAEKLGLFSCSNQPSSLFLEKPEIDTDEESSSTFDYKSTRLFSNSGNYKDIIFFLDDKGGIVKINQAASFYSNVTEDYVLNKLIWDVPEILGKNDKSEVQILFNNIINGAENISVAGEFINKKGEKQVFDFSFYPSFDDNKLKYVLVIGRNNTYLKNIENELKENRIKFNSLVEYFEVISDTTISIGRKDLFSDVNDIIFQISLDGRISYINSAVGKIAGYSPEQMIGSKLSFLIPKQDWKKFKKQLSYSKDQDLTNRQIDGFETVIKKKDGTFVSAELNAKLIQNKKDIIGKKDQIRIQGSIRDITERKKAEEERLRHAEKLREINDHLKKANAELKATQNELKILNEGLENKVAERTAEIEKLLKHKDEFIGQLGHDLKSPLTPLVGLLPYAEEKEDDPEVKEILMIANRNVGYMRDLVTKTLQLERLNLPNFKLVLSNFNIYESVETIVENKKFSYDERNIKVCNKIHRNFAITADKVQFDEILDNLFTNAIKFSHDGGTITFDASKNDDFITVSVNDNGIGLTSEHIEHIFEEFYKVDPSRHDLESSGLGLSICKRIVEKHGGKIWVESPGLGKGSTFYFTIPAKTD